MTAAPVVLTAELFAPHVGQIFQVEGVRLADGEGFALALSEVERGEPQPWRDTPPFTLVFSGPPGVILAEGMHMLALPDGPVCELYLMPIHTPAPGRQDYQAVFN